MALPGHLLWNMTHDDLPIDFLGRDHDSPRMDPRNMGRIKSQRSYLSCGLECYLSNVLKDNLVAFVAGMILWTPP